MTTELLIPVALGVGLHAVVWHIEIDSYLLPLTGLLSIIEAALIYSEIRMYGSTFPEALSTVSIRTFLVTSGLVSSILIYRAFFHRLRRFPGPLAARLTKFHAAWLSAGKVQYHLELQRLHHEYGDVVRTGPRELTIFRPEAVGPLAVCGKTLVYMIGERSTDKSGVIETRDIEDHRRRRRPWDAALSNPSMRKYDPPMQKVIGHFLDALASPELAGKPVDVTDWMAYLAWDLMGIVGFGKEFGQVKNGGVEHWAVKALRDQQLFVGYAKPVPWLMYTMQKIPVANRLVKPFVDYCTGLVDEKMSTRPDLAEIPSDILSWLLREYVRKTPYAPKTWNAISADARLIGIAGGDTTSNSLINMLFYLARDPRIYRELQAQLSLVFPDGPESFSYATLAANLDAVPLLDAILNETLRLKPATLSGNPRVTPPEGLRIPGVKFGCQDGKEAEDLFIPGDVNVYVPQYVVQRDPRYFPHPDEFMPERWITGEARPGSTDAFFPFQIGQFACPGKDLAMWEMRSVLARVALQFDFAFGGDSEADAGRAFDEGMMDTFVQTLTPLWLVFKERQL